MESIYVVALSYVGARVGVITATSGAACQPFVRPYVGARVGAASMSAPPVSAASLKAELLAACRPLEMGTSATSRDRERIRSLLDRLVAAGDGVADPASIFYSDAERAECDPTEPSIAGRWKLVYTDAPDVLSLNYNPLASLSSIGQTCDAGAKTIANVIEWKPPGMLEKLPFSQLPVKLPYDPLAERIEQRVVLKAAASRTAPRRVDLFVEGLDVVPLRVFGRAGMPLELRGPLSGQLPFGSFDLLYMDRDLRIVKTVQGGHYAVNVRADGDGLGSSTAGSGSRAGWSPAGAAAGGATIVAEEPVVIDEDVEFEKVERAPLVPPAEPDSEPDSDI
jgi:hypothetical protein